MANDRRRAFSKSYSGGLLMQNAAAAFGHYFASLIFVRPAFIEIMLCYGQRDRHRARPPPSLIFIVADRMIRHVSPNGP